ncbi:hypothetical protein GCM10010435_76650 [Winogradskya consettensis]|uniref:AbiJ N-terminal domain-containing protein n=1 Tax=Winogradskya consettensis TaxID=113560 RepID=A0A919SLW9_9ACTN|nr:hypothetical protein [Actinoplanes consettensis]GIM74551.1 hypothetical protein Aco04nite_40860 [Actinoplanes consettensis]
MYNLIVGFTDGEASPDRVVEYTDDAIRAYVEPGGKPDVARLLNLPTLVMPEIDRGSPQVARVGHLENLRLDGRNYRFRFVPSAVSPEISCSRIQAVADRLDIREFEFRRTHWAVKDVDLHRVLHEVSTRNEPGSTVFSLPVNRPREPDLVAVMMPFDARFDPVTAALRQASEDAGLRCLRADDIWEHHHIMDDVISLIWRAQVVIADFTGRNPNVFYEAGIAHSLGRDVIQITQSDDDVPFDLRSIRSLHYHANGEGLELLRSKLTDRLRDLVKNSA